MRRGRLIAVVGPSGVGKDTVIAGIAAALPGIGVVRRTITRAPDLGGEDYDAVSEDVFEAMVERGAFCLHWRSHGLRYGIPAEVLEAVQGGAQRIANLSRAALTEAAAIFPGLVVVNITASPEVLAKRLSRRGRETGAEIEARLVQAARSLPDGLDVITLNNDGPLEETVAHAVAALRPVQA